MNTRDTLRVNDAGHLEIGGIDTVDLVKKYGTPLYVMDKIYIKKMCEVYRDTLENEYGNGLICYASKAFSCKEMYRIANEQNIGIDVVSAGELYTATTVNFPKEKICFHGNNKTNAELEFAVKYGVGTIILDSLSEADKLDKIASDNGIIQNVLIRVNPGVEAHTHHYIQTAKIDSKFGFSISNGDAFSAVKYVADKQNLKLKGLHCHIGSQIFEKKSFAIATEKMVAFYKTVFDELGIEFDVLNLGGGFGIWYGSDDAKLSVKDYADYIKTISETLKSCVKKNRIKKPYLILEPGRSIVGEAGITLYTVGHIKEIKNVKNYLSIDGGMFDNPRFALYQAKYTVCPADRMYEKPVKTYTIAGKCCVRFDKKMHEKYQKQPAYFFRRLN